VDTLSYKTISLNKETVEKNWLLIDATNVPVGRLSSTIAIILRGKHKAGFTPHVDCGDNVVVINAEKVIFTGKKMEDKEYFRHTGYPGGQRIESPAKWMRTDPRKIVEHAVKGMLPRNRLSRRLIRNLYVYVGGNHPHEAQKPTLITIDKIK
jgi:large subunit ribosomal protein L13